jgi:MULE transposase domain/FAR1 DNA-binding domain
MSSQRHRTRSPSPDDELRPRKRQRQSRQSRFSTPLLANSPQSASSIATSIAQYYGAGDEDALGNIFASYPETFTTAPWPHGSRGLNEPPWELRFDQEIYLSNDFLARGRQLQRVRMPIPGPEINQIPSYSPPQSAYKQSSPTRAQFQSALRLVSEVTGTDRELNLELVQSYERVRQWRERWGYSPLSSDAFESPPPYSPPRDRHSPTNIASPHSPDHSLSPVPDPIPNPPIPGDPAPSAEVLFDWVNTFSKAYGFGIVRRNAYSYKGRKIRYSFQCDRFGEPGPTKGVGIRQRKSRKCGCKWMVVAEALEEGKWLLRQHSNPEHSQHNHGRSIGPSAHPSHRRLTTPIRDTVKSTSRRVGIRARDVRAVVQEQHPESVFTQRDIYNARSLINRDKLNGHTSTAALIKLFDEIEIPYFVKWADNDPNRLLGLVWTFPYCLQMWKRFPEVISFDNTYNTNRFKLPLFQATGQTCLGSVFNAAFGLIDNERREGFQFLSESIRQLAEQHSIQQPDVIITDFDDSMKAALNDQFPDVQQQLCIHHINSNVLLKSKQKWVKSCYNSSSPDNSDREDFALPIEAELSPKDRHFIYAPEAETIPHSYQGILMMWKLVLFAETEEAHEKAWGDLCREFDDQRAILRYLHGTYMPVRAQWARCFIRKYRNFGIRVTSGTEASNNNVKSYLLNGMSHLYRLVEAIEDMIKDQERDFAHACAEDEVLTAREYLGSNSEYLGELRTAISSKSLGLITKQYRLARKAMPTGKNPFPDPLGDCSEDCSVSAELGIPCCHKIYSKIVAGTPFTKWDVHPRWRLRESTSRDPYQRILDPKIATALRGRPKNTTQAVPMRLAIGASSQSSIRLASKPATQPASQASGRRRGRPPGSRNKSRLARLALEASQQASPSSQPQICSQSAVLGSGRTTGVRASGRRTQPSIRRRRSQWEMVQSDEEALSCITVKK